MSQANSSLGAEDTPATYGKYRISEEERQLRIEAVEYANASLAFEGLDAGEDVAAINQQFIDGDLTMEESGRMIRALVGM